jgi:hypothetical protein
MACTRPSRSAAPRLCGRLGINSAALSRPSKATSRCRPSPLPNPQAPRPDFRSCNFAPASSTRRWRQASNAILSEFAHRKHFALFPWLAATRWRQIILIHHHRPRRQWRRNAHDGQMNGDPGRHGEPCGPVQPTVQMRRALFARVPTRNMSQTASLSRRPISR